MRIIEGGGHVHLKGWQQVAVAVGSALGALMNPRRADLIAALGETSGKLAFQNLLDRMKRNPEGRIILQERPRVISSAVGHAWDLPANTFGAAYANFMGSRNFSPDDRPPVRFMETEELAYVATRAREIHDFWHVLFNLPTNMLGESALKVVEFQQMYLPMCLLSIAGGSMRLKGKQRERFFKYYFPWALRAGMSCTDIMSVYYEKYFGEDLEVVRHKWGDNFTKFTNKMYKIIFKPIVSMLCMEFLKFVVIHVKIGYRLSKGGFDEPTPTICTWCLS